MIKSNTKKVIDEISKHDKSEDKIKVTMLDSGVNYSPEINVVERKNFIRRNEEEQNYAIEDETGHGTSIAQILVGKPNESNENELQEDEIEEDADVTSGSAVEQEEELDDVEELSLEDEYEIPSELLQDPKEDDLPEYDEIKSDQSTDEGDSVSMYDILHSSYDFNKGINPNIELYSGKVLDANNQTNIDRLVEGIEWAIENKSNILSLSIGVENDSKKLHDAIKKARKAGILIIAAAGNDSKIDYPAAYDEVMSVGKVNSLAQTTDTECEIVAPGENVISRGVFDSMQTFSGTSIAVPHVVGVASILWQKDKSKSADFIRGLIDASARKIGNQITQNSLIDCEYALEKYDEYQGCFEETQNYFDENGIEDNCQEVVSDNETAEVFGKWTEADHVALVSKDNNSYIHNSYLYMNIMKKSIVISDQKESNLNSMKLNPWFHGFFGGIDTEGGKEGKISNYFTSFRTLYTMAASASKATETNSNDDIYKMHVVGDEASDNAIRGINNAFRGKDIKKGMFGNVKWSSIHNMCSDKSNKFYHDCRSLTLLGMALHTLSDTFAHSSYAIDVVKKKVPVKDEKKDYRFCMKWFWLNHENGNNLADVKIYRELRYKAAKQAVNKCLKKISVKSDGHIIYAGIDDMFNIYFSTNAVNKIKEMFKKLWTKKDGKNRNFKIRGAKNRNYVKKGFLLNHLMGFSSQEISNIKKYNSQNSNQQINLDTSSLSLDLKKALDVNRCASEVRQVVKLSTIMNNSRYDKIHVPNYYVYSRRK